MSNKPRGNKYHIPCIQISRNVAETTQSRLIKMFKSFLTRMIATLHTPEPSYAKYLTVFMNENKDFFQTDFEKKKWSNKYHKQLTVCYSDAFEFHIPIAYREFIPKRLDEVDNYAHYLYQCNVMFKTKYAFLFPLEIIPKAWVEILKGDERTEKERSKLFFAFVREEFYMKRRTIHSKENLLHNFDMDSPWLFYREYTVQDWAKDQHKELKEIYNLLLDNIIYYSYKSFIKKFPYPLINTEEGTKERNSYFHETYACFFPSDYAGEVWDFITIEKGNIEEYHIFDVLNPY